MKALLAVKAWGEMITLQLAGPMACPSHGLAPGCRLSSEVVLPLRSTIVEWVCRPRVGHSDHQGLWKTGTVQPRTPHEADKCERVALSSTTKRLLWAESGGYCQNPVCGVYLFPEGSEIDFAEMAHIIAASSGGSRDVPKADVSDKERAAASNVAVLCANCHTKVDKDPARYPIEMMAAWKERHRTGLKELFGTPKFSTREEARSYIEPLLDENRTLFDAYGPDSCFSEERAERWHHHALRSIVPNNAAIARMLKVNRPLLTAAERMTADTFDLHETEFAARHVLDDFSAGTRQYPHQMNTILKDT
jgi:hypothetical protein